VSIRFIMGTPREVSNPKMRIFAQGQGKQGGFSEAYLPYAAQKTLKFDTAIAEKGH